MFPVPGFVYAPSASTHRGTARLLPVLETLSAKATPIPVTYSTAVAQLHQLTQSYSKTLVVKCITEEDKGAPPEESWSCTLSVNGTIRARAVAKPSKQKAVEAAAGDALAFLIEMGYR
jgi:hypothetical protein